MTTCPSLGSKSASKNENEMAIKLLEDMSDGFLKSRKPTANVTLLWQFASERMFIAGISGSSLKVGAPSVLDLRVGSGSLHGC